MTRTDFTRPADRAAEPRFRAAFEPLQLRSIHSKQLQTTAIQTPFAAWTRGRLCWSTTKLFPTNHGEGGVEKKNKINHPRSAQPSWCTLRFKIAPSICFVQLLLSALTEFLQAAGSSVQRQEPSLGIPPIPSAFPRSALTLFPSSCNSMCSQLLCQLKFWGLKCIFSRLWYSLSSCFPILSTQML